MMSPDERALLISLTQTVIRLIGNGGDITNRAAAMQELERLLTRSKPRGRRVQQVDTLWPPLPTRRSGIPTPRPTSGATRR
jgi:hypothetical protein